MAKIRSLAEIAAKWKDVTPRREAYYRAGIEKPKENWEEKTVAAAEAWKSGVDEAGAEGFAGGVKKAGTAKWQTHTKIKGVEQGRWREGVTAFADNYAKEFAPFRDVIESIELPPRGRKGDPANIRRVEAIATALHQKKLELRGRA